VASVQNTCTGKGKNLLQVSLSKGESIGIMDGGKQLIFRRNNLPVHHLVVQRHHGEIQVRVLAGELFQGSIEPSSEDLARAQLELFNLLLEPLVLLF